MQVNLLNMAGDTPKRIQLPAEMFDVAFNEPLVHQVSVAYMAAGRAGTKAQKTRAQVRGGKAKPWRQKGTGRARAGSTRGPLWRTGGVTFAASGQRDFSQKVNKKMYAQAMRAILSQLARSNRLHVIESLALEQPKTKSLMTVLDKLQLDDVLIVIDNSGDRNLTLAARNSPNVHLIRLRDMNPVVLMKHDNVLFIRAALEQLNAGDEKE